MAVEKITKEVGKDRDTPASNHSDLVEFEIELHHAAGDDQDAAVSWQSAEWDEYLLPCEDLFGLIHSPHDHSASITCGLSFCWVY